MKQDHIVLLIYLFGAMVFNGAREKGFAQQHGSGFEFARSAVEEITGQISGHKGGNPAGKRLICNRILQNLLQTLALRGYPRIHRAVRVSERSPGCRLPSV